MQLGARWEKSQQSLCFAPNRERNLWRLSWTADAAQQFSCAANSSSDAIRLQAAASNGIEHGLFLGFFVGLGFGLGLSGLLGNTIRDGFSVLLFHPDHLVIVPARIFFSHWSC